MPTLAELAGVEAPEHTDGISFVPFLLGGKDQQKHAYLYWEFHEQGGRQALRKGDWKLVRCQVQDSLKATTELYDLRTDTGEENNVAAQHPEVVAGLLKLMGQARTPSDVFPFKLPTVNP
jgi:arylsulfatase A-like enzyme